jgi:DNA-binding XRE family transcriptional regulator
MIHVGFSSTTHVSTSSTDTIPRQATVFAQNLLVARTVLDLTQHALAAASGVSRATIAQLEAGTGDPKLSTVQQLAEALGVSPVVLLLGRRELEALGALLGDAVAPDATMNVMRHLVSAGGVRSRLEAARLGIGVAEAAGIEGGAVGAAVGSFHHPGQGTVAGAKFARAVRAGNRA